MSYLYRPSPSVIFRTTAELDEAYDVEGSVESFEKYIEFFDRASEAARAETENTLDIPYGHTRAETLDVFHGPPGGPVVFFIHGGYWKSVSSKDESYLGTGMTRAGATVVVPDYALLPHVTIDEIVRQMRAAFAWTKKHIAEFGGDPDRIVLAGHSAGAHLAVRVLQTDWADYGIAADPIVGACAMSGLYDLRPLPYTSMQTEFRFTADQVLRNSPMLGLPEAAPHLLVSYGELQPPEFLRQSRDFFEAWRGAGLSGECWARPGLDHFNELADFLDPESELVRRVLRLAG
ncbi:MAG: alpha/beta hydrolase [Candidatus Leucobacter sulfamidivorax]|nr:alpha/beta hydrolase [Candidatus Leucobacter sulfamidivorax]